MTEAKIVRVPNEVEIMAKTMSPPMWTSGINEDAMSAPNPILENTSSKMG